MPMRVHDIPGPHDAYVTVPAVGSGVSSFSYPIFVAPWSAKVTLIEAAFGSAMVGDDSNRFDFVIYNRGTDGSGTAEWSTLSLESGDSADAYVPTTIFSLATGSAIEEGAVLDLYYDKQGNGFDVSRAVIHITFMGA